MESCISLTDSLTTRTMQEQNVLLGMIYCMLSLVKVSLNLGGKNYDVLCRLVTVILGGFQVL